MLEVSARFRRYSLNNQLLLWAQASQRGMRLTRVAAFGTWRALGYRVRAGETGLRIFGPVSRRLGAEEVAAWGAAGRDPFDRDGRPRRVVRGFTVEYVFDRSQVDPGPAAQPLPDDRGWVAQHGDGPAGLWPALVALTDAHGFTLTVRPPTPADGGAHGWTDYATRTVWVNSACDQAERVRILAHETAGHLRCGHEHRRDISRAQRETEADSVAYVVLAALGLDISSSTVEYVADWSRGDPRVLRAAADTVHRVATAVLADLDADLDPADPHDTTG
jgi:antirestriction protein ArdC